MLTKAADTGPTRRIDNPPCGKQRDSRFIEVEATFGYKNRQSAQVIDFIDATQRSCPDVAH